ncbi:MAG TPA: OmpA family protein [Beijerinckiaceae bacterium]|jgi:outer membrane protein OmpA-like peptidoglycan-associated protein|nr:OmpA family protein [Beijerinckiaceae bacterium]
MTHFRLSLLFLLALPTVSRAADARSDAINFRSDEIKFSSQEIAFPSMGISFPSQAILTEKGGTIELTLPADILFDFDKADIRPTAQSALHEVANLVRTKARGPVAIQGYTDALGSDAYNQKLSERRANSVKSWMVSNEKLAATNLSVKGLGARDPVAPNRNADGTDNPDGRQLNRRVTFIIKK